MPTQPKAINEAIQYTISKSGLAKDLSGNAIASSYSASDLPVQNLLSEN
jgi:hypothetical protein